MFFDIYWSINLTNSGRQGDEATQPDTFFLQGKENQCVEMKTLVQGTLACGQTAHVERLKMIVLANADLGYSRWRCHCHCVSSVCMRTWNSTYNRKQLYLLECSTIRQMLEALISCFRITLKVYFSCCVGNLEELWSTHQVFFPS